MTRRRRGQNRKQRSKNKNSTINSFNDENVVDKKYFPDDYFVNNGDGDLPSFSNILSKQLHDDHKEFIPHNTFHLKQRSKRHRRQMNSNFSVPSNSFSNKLNADGSIYFNSNKTEARPLQEKNSTINNLRSSIAELVMKGEIDHSLDRVTTGRPTIVIYPTGSSRSN